MRFAVVIEPIAKIDTYDAAAWYEDECRGLGSAFLDEIERVLIRIRENPFQFPAVHRDFRRALLHRFPYSVYLRVEGRRVLVKAVLHQHRDPDAFRSRK